MAQLLRFLRNFDRNIAILAFCLMQATVFLQVFTRYVMNFPLAWPEEVARYSLVWLTFMGASAAVRSNEHIRIDALLIALPERGRRWLLVLTNLLAIGVMLAALPAGLTLVNMMVGVPTAALQISTSWVYLPVPLSFAFMSAQLAQITRAEFRALRAA
jgi:TRAP-type C4-dicarboxylate transport system permease small subunit